MKPVAKRDLDVSKIFLAYVSFQGDPARTAIACDVERHTVEALAVQEGWSSKISQFSALQEGDQNFQVTLNRTLNFIQARQLAGLVDAVILKLSESPEALMDTLTTVTKNGTSFQVRPLTDLVKAAETIQLMTCRALGDSGERLDQGQVSGASIGLSVAKALNAVAANAGVDPVTIVQKSLHDPAGISGAPS